MLLQRAVLLSPLFNFMHFEINQTSCHIKFNRKRNIECAFYRRKCDAMYASGNQYRRRAIKQNAAWSKNGRVLINRHIERESAHAVAADVAVLQSDKYKLLFTVLESAVSYGNLLVPAAAAAQNIC
jgi:hypothetical protein